jgi:hypothetical protein
MDYVGYPLSPVEVEKIRNDADARENYMFLTPKRDNGQVEACKRSIERAFVMATKAMEQGEHTPVLDAINTILLINDVRECIAILEGRKADGR